MAFGSVVRDIPFRIFTTAWPLEMVSSKKSGNMPSSKLVSPYLFIGRSDPSWPKQEIRAEKVCTEKAAGIQICSEQEEETWQIIAVEVQTFCLDESRLFLSCTTKVLLTMRLPSKNTGGLGLDLIPWIPQGFNSSPKLLNTSPRC